MPKDRTARRGLLLGVLVFAAALATWAFLDSEWNEKDLGAPTLAAEGVESDALLALELEPLVETPDTERESLVLLPQEPGEPGPEEALVEEEYPVRGTFVLSDCFGRELTTLNGRFEVITHFGKVRQSRMVELRRGSFEFSVPNPTQFYVHELELEGRELELDLQKELTGPHDDQRLSLSARDQCEVRLEVVDAATGAPLRGVEVWSEDDLDSSAILLPLVEYCDHVLKDGASPILLPWVDIGWARLRTYWVHVEGYAWGKVGVDHSRPGDYLIRLGPPAALAVRVVGLAGKRLGGKDLWLHLRRKEDNAVLAFAKLGSSFTHRWERVPLGSYRLCVDLGGHWDDPLTLASAAVELSSSDEVSVVLEASPPDVPIGPVQVSGTLRVGAFWREQGFSLGFHGIGEAERWGSWRLGVKFSDLAADAVDPDLLHWSEELPCVGTWQVSVGRLGVHEDFEVGPSGAQGIELTVPDPAQLSILLKDAETGHILPSLGVWYSYAGETRHRTIVWPRMKFDPKSGRHRVAMPAGRVSLRVSSRGYADAEDELDLKPGEHELSYELAPCARVDFAFTNGVAAVPVNMLEVEVEATPVDGVGEISEVWFQGLVFSEPGPYQLKFRGIRGYLEAETRVEVPVRGVVSHSVHLVRE